MSYAVDIAGPAMRRLSEQLAGSAATACLNFIFGALAESPRRVGHPLREPFLGQWVARRGEYRIRYEIDEMHRVVHVKDVDHRRSIYRRR